MKLYIQNLDINLFKDIHFEKSYKKNYIYTKEGILIEKKEKYFKLTMKEENYHNLEYKSYKAYSLNKGEEIVLCLHDKDGKLIQDKNTMKFVLIHELAHVMTVENGHPPIFWKNMGYLLKEASSIGIYDAIDYSKNPVYYCGVLVDKTPYPF